MPAALQLLDEFVFQLAEGEGEPLLAGAAFVEEGGDGLEGDG